MHLIEYPKHIFREYLRRRKVCYNSYIESPLCDKMFIGAKQLKNEDKDKKKNVKPEKQINKQKQTNTKVERKSAN